MISKIIRKNLINLQCFNAGKIKGPKQLTKSLEIQDSVNFRYDITPEKNTKFDYDENSQYEQVTKKQDFVVNPNQRIRKKILSKEFKIYEKKQKDMLLLTSEEYKQKYNQDQIVEQDDLWQDKPVPQRIFEKVTIKEINWLPRDEFFAEYSKRKNLYLTEFNKDSQINPQIDEVFQQIKIKCKDLIDNMSPQIQVENEMITQEPELFNKLKELIQNVHFSEFLEIGKKLNEIRYKKDDLQIWKNIEENLKVGLHSFNVKQLIKLQWILDSLKPKAGSPLLHKQIRDLIKEDIQQCDIYDIMHLYHANRMLKHDIFHSYILEQIQNRRDEIINSQDFDLIPNLIYTFANCRLPSYCRKKMRVKNEFKDEALKFVNQYHQYILYTFHKMSFDAQIRLILSIQILKLRDFNDILYLMELSIYENLDKLDSFQTYQILYNLSKFNDGKAEGSKKLYETLENKVIQLWDTFGNKQKSAIYFSYVNRNLLSDNLNKQYIQPWIEKELKNLTHDQLYQVAFCFMAMKETNKEIWRQFVQNVCSQDLIVPIHYLQNFKLAKLYIQGLFPKWNLDQYEKACFSSEQYYSQVRLRDNFNDRESVEAMKFYINDLNINIKTWIEHQNTLIIDMAVMPEKIAILVVKKRDKNEENQISFQIQIKKTILESQGWDVLYHDNQILDQMPFDEKLQTQKEIFEKSYQKMSQLYQEQSEQRIQEEYEVLFQKAAQMDTYRDTQQKEIKKNPNKKSDKLNIDQLDTVIKFKK